VAWAATGSATSDDVRVALLGQVGTEMSVLILAATL
jgi:hypothetical protein